MCCKRYSYQNMSVHSLAFVLHSEIRCLASLLSLSLLCTSPLACFLMLVFLNGSRCVSWSHSIIYDPPTVQHCPSRCLNMLHISQPPAYKLREMNSMPFSIFISFVPCCSVLHYYQTPPHAEYIRPAHLWIPSLYKPRCVFTYQAHIHVVIMHADIGQKFANIIFIIT